MTNTTTHSPATLSWHATPTWLRRLAVDADIYGDAGIANLVRNARNGDAAAIVACRRLAGV